MRVTTGRLVRTVVVVVVGHGTNAQGTKTAQTRGHGQDDAKGAGQHDLSILIVVIVLLIAVVGNQHAPRNHEGDGHQTTQGTATQSAIQRRRDSVARAVNVTFPTAITLGRIVPIGRGCIGVGLWCCGLLFLLVWILVAIVIVVVKQFVPSFRRRCFWLFRLWCILVVVVAKRSGRNDGHRVRRGRVVIRRRRWLWNQGLGFILVLHFGFFRSRRNGVVVVIRKVVAKIVGIVPAGHGGDEGKLLEESR
mmetsp:Transcript_22455/g.48886  ORF Transcript_22455/g.48886 Transcript_22455/m.48886 type:complete len:249 (+) Transcript_22455:1367-2113(+)